MDGWITLYSLVKKEPMDLISKCWLAEKGSETLLMGCGQPTQQ
jgi:hypothetical protein